jgi:hypothetical protein
MAACTANSDKYCIAVFQPPKTGWEQSGQPTYSIDNMCRTEEVSSWHKEPDFNAIEGIVDYPRRKE